MSTHSNLSDYDSNTIPDSEDLKVGIVVSKWNSDITESLYDGAYNTLIECSVSKNNIKRIDVPGSFELIYGSKLMINSNVDVVIAIGCVIQGQTKHFDYVCQSVSNGIAQLNTLYETPVVFCVLTDINKQQSLDRSGGKFGNKGVESAITAIKLCNLGN